MGSSQPRNSIYYPTAYSYPYSYSYSYPLYNYSSYAYPISYSYPITYSYPAYIPPISTPISSTLVPLSPRVIAASKSIVSTPIATTIL